MVACTRRSWQIKRTKDNTENIVGREGQDRGVQEEFKRGEPKLN